MLGRFLGAGIALGFGGIGASIGMGITAGHATTAMMRQPERQNQLLRSMFIGQAVGSSSSIFALVIGLLILMKPFPNPDISPMHLAAIFIGAGLSVGMGGFGSGWGCGYPAGEACEGVARNPRKTNQIMQLMFIGQSLTDTPCIFAVVIALLLLFAPINASGMAVVGICLGAGLAVGAGALGPGIGSGVTAGGAVAGASYWPQTHGLMLRNMLLAQAVSQTPAIFGLLVGLIMLYAMKDIEPNIVGLSRAIGAGISVGFGALGPGIGSGMAGDGGCRATARRPRSNALVIRTMLLGQAISQSTAIYALIIALALLYVVK